MELSQIKEDLLREKHSNELRMKSMVSHMEERARAEEQSTHIVEERERTLRNIIRAYEKQRSRATIAELEGKLIQSGHIHVSGAVLEKSSGGLKSYA